MAYWIVNNYDDLQWSFKIIHPQAL